MKYACHCCGNLTMEQEPTDTFDICPVCFWEHEYESDFPFGLAWGCNGVSLEQARRNYKDIGACAEKDLPHVRKPLPEEIPVGA